MNKNWFLFLLVVSSIFLTGMQPAQALPVYDLDYEYSGGTRPQGTAPWLTAEFTDVFDRGDVVAVDLKLSTSGLVGGEFVTRWLFNIHEDVEDKLNTSSLIFDPFSPPLKSLGLTANKYSGDGAHGFDIELWFPSAMAYRFGAGDDPITFRITSDVFDVTAALFDVDNNYKNPPYFRTVAHVQGIGPDGEDGGWIAPNPVPVPDPASLLLVGLGLIGVVGFGRRRFKAPNPDRRESPHPQMRK